MIMMMNMMMSIANQKRKILIVDAKSKTGKKHGQITKTDMMR